MAKQINLNHKGKDYTLEFTRRSVADMERAGFIASDISEKPISTIPALFEGAFRAHQKFMKKEIIDDIFRNITRKDVLLEKLTEMYNEPIMSLVEEPEENEGNVEWTES